MKSINVKSADIQRLVPGKWTVSSYPQVIKKTLFCFSVALCLAGCKKGEVSGDAAPVASGKGAGSTSQAVADFTIAVIPDTQYYVSSQHGGTPAMFTKQIDWIKANQVAENIVYVASLGDITDHGNDVASEWTNASTNGYYKLESQPGFTNGIPYGTCVGNHDQTPNTGHPLTCSTSGYNGKFGANRFRPRAYYGESYAGSSSNNNDSHYDFFTAGGINFIVIYVEYDSHGDDSAVNTWVYNTLVTHSNRKAIIVSHMMTNASGAWGTTGSSYEQGHVLYDRIKGRTNVFMMLGGHFTGESLRADSYASNSIRTYLSDYQGRTNGGNGYMRLMKFSVNNNTVSVKTYSPHLGTYETDANSQFTQNLFSYAIEPLNPPAMPLANGKYKITSRLSASKAMVVQGASTVNNAPVVLYDYVGTNHDNDEWNLIQLSNGYYRIQNALSLLDLNVDHASYQNAAQILQYTYAANSQYNDEWAIISVGSGYYKIISRHSAMGLNVEGGLTANGTSIVQYPYTATANNEWLFTVVP